MRTVVDASCKPIQLRGPGHSLHGLLGTKLEKACQPLPFFMPIRSENPRSVDPTTVLGRNLPAEHWMRS